MTKYVKPFLLACILIYSNHLCFAADMRCGINSFKNLSQTAFESGNYRLDPDFTLGLGDTLQVNLWGKLEAQHQLKIARDGYIVIPLLGRVSLMGLTLEEARQAIQREINKRYTNVNFDLSLVDVQDIRIEVLGHACNPGVYALSPFTRLIDAVAKAGGPSETGSLIDIQVIRHNKVIAHFNYYDFIKNADQSQNIRLKHDDIIFVPIIHNVISLQGELQNPGKYEMRDGASLKEAINLAGGLKKTLLKKKIYIRRLDPQTKRKEMLKELVVDSFDSVADQDNIALIDQDQIIVTTNFDFIPYEEQFFKSIAIKGEVQIPGQYLIKDGDTLLGVMKKAGGLKETAFVKGAVFTRKSIKEKQQSLLDEMIKSQKIALLEEEALLAGKLLSQQQREFGQMALTSRKQALDLLAARVPQGRIVIDFEQILNGNNGELILENGDSLYIPTRPDWVLVIGEVYNPQAILYKSDQPKDYYIEMVGGLKNTADRDGMYIIKANGRTQSKATGFGAICRGDIIMVPQEMDK